MNRPLLIVVPFYKQPHLIDQIGTNLLALRAEIQEQNVQVLFVNDSPTELEVGERLSRWWIELLTEFPIEVVTNEKNLGFVRSTNIGLHRAKEIGADALMLNSDVILAPGALTEMRRVAELEPMIGFVNPRSNNATIASLPFATRHEPRNFDEGYRNFRKLSRFLPEFSYVPTAVGFCMLVKHAILADFGFLDVAYSPGYNEENDLCFRANRAGFRPVLANHAFCYHESSSSFKEEQRRVLDLKNRTLLLARYPEYETAVSRYLQSPAFLFEQTIPAHLLRDSATVRVALDFSHFRADHAGTFEFGLSLLSGMVANADPHVRLYVICEEPVAAFHHLSSQFPEAGIVSPQSDDVFDIVLKPAQPFCLDDFMFLSRRGLYNFVFMLDTIAWDCHYICNQDIEPIWNLVSEVMDGVLFISDYSRDQFNHRFRNAQDTPQLSCQLSVHQDDYSKSFAKWCRAKGEEKAEPALELPENYLLLFGNHYEHKFIEPTARMLLERFDELQVVALSTKLFSHPRLHMLKAGTLSDLAMEELYVRAKFFVFPSHYEGFGFPVVHALARGKVVLARESSLNRQIGSRWDGGGQLVLFRDLDHLAELFQLVLDDEEHFLQLAGDAVVRRSEAKTFGWKEMAAEVTGFMRSVAQRDPFAKRSLERFTTLRNYEMTGSSRAMLDRVHQLEQENNRLRSAAALSAESLTTLEQDRARMQLEFERTEAERSLVMNSPAFRIGRQVTGIAKRIPGAHRVYSSIGSTRSRRS